MPRGDTGGRKARFAKLTKRTLCTDCKTVMESGAWAVQYDNGLGVHKSGSLAGYQYSDCPTNNMPRYWVIKQFAEYVSAQMLAARNRGEYNQPRSIINNAGLVVEYITDPQNDEVYERIIRQACRRFNISDPR